MTPSAGASRTYLPVLVISDIDGTMLGNDEGLARFNQLWAQMPVGSKLCFNTSRTLDSFRRSAFLLLEPLEPYFPTTHCAGSSS